jgi:hypothetical protein
MKVYRQFSPFIPEQAGIGSMFHPVRNLGKGYSEKYPLITGFPFHFHVFQVKNNRRFEGFLKFPCNALSMTPQIS